MKKFVSEFMRRGMVAGGFGPIILAIVYLSLYHNGVIETLTVEEVCKGIFSLTAQKRYLYCRHTQSMDCAFT